MAGRVLLNNSASPGGGGVSHPPPSDPPPPLIGLIFLRAFGQSKFLSGAFGASHFRPKNLFGAFEASNNSRSPEGGGGGTPPPLKENSGRGAHS